MNFKEKLAITFSETRKREQEELDKQIAKLVRTDEEWEIIKEHLATCILTKASTPFSARVYPNLSGKWISFYVTDSASFLNPYYTFKDVDFSKADFCKKHEIIINWKDMERFCQEEGLDLRYGLNTSFGPGEAKLIKHNDYNVFVNYYLVKVS